MEHNIKIEGTVNLTFPDLVKAATILADAFKGNTSGSENISKEEQKEPKEIKDTNMLSDVQSSEALEKPKLVNLHYGQKEDGTTYTKWNEMCKALDEAGSDKAKQVLAEYSENGMYGGVKPADWDKVIKVCSKVPEQKKTYTLEEVRALARKIQTEKGKETLHAIFQSFNKEKLSQFKVDEYGDLYDALSKEAA